MLLFLKKHKNLVFLEHQIRTALSNQFVGFTRHSTGYLRTEKMWMDTYNKKTGRQSMNKYTLHPFLTNFGTNAPNPRGSGRWIVTKILFCSLHNLPVAINQLTDDVYQQWFWSNSKQCWSMQNENEEFHSCNRQPSGIPECSSMRPDDIDGRLFCPYLRLALLFNFLRRRFRGLFAF